MEKKNYLKLASGLLVLCLMTTCAISATFAKYATGGSSSDTARVAKWGVKIELQGDDLFNNEYENDASVVTVSTATEQLVAPGTKEVDKLTFAISGTPEVSLRVEFAFTDVKDVFLKAGTYNDETTAVADDTFVLADDYYPVAFTLTRTKNEGAVVSEALVTDGKLSEVQAAVEALDKSYNPGSTLDSVYELTWKWVFAGNDQADTVLGNLAAGNYSGTGLVAGTNYNLNLAFDLAITATQVD